MKIVNNIPKNIFRGYDIRGLDNSELNEDVAYTIGQTYANKVLQENKKAAVVGYDNRFSSPILYKALVQGMLDAGLSVIGIGLVTTPMYYFALDKFKTGAGIMITASHNPKEYNGFKMTFNGVFNAYGDLIQDFMELTTEQKPIKTFSAILENIDIRQDYVNYITSCVDISGKPLKIIVDCGNGTGSTIINEVFNKLKFPFIPLFCDSNPDFPNHHPDPSVEENLELLKQAVIKHNADLGIALDGDADRVGIVNEKGEMVNIDSFMIVIIRDIINNLSDKRILFDVKCSKALEDEIIKLGGTPICYRTGNSYLRAKIYEDKILFGGELSGHVFFNDKFYGFDDGIYAGLRAIEILSKTNLPFSRLLDGVNHYYSTRELKVNVNDEEKFLKVEKVKEYCLKNNYNFLDIDGCKVIFDDGFALIRASNTGPNITMRFEAKTEDRLKAIQEEFESLLRNII